MSATLLPIDTTHPVQLIRRKGTLPYDGHELHLAVQFLVVDEAGVDLSHLQPQQSLKVRVALLGVQLEKTQSFVLFNYRRQLTIA